MIRFLTAVHGLVWGLPALVLILGIGMYLSWRTGFAQITMFPRALAEFFRKFCSRHSHQDSVSPFRALCTALGATVGTGNIIGVAGAICLGGPGAVFWMWICGFLGMATKYAEATLAVHYRKQTSCGYVGGPMYSISRGMGSKWRPLAVCYCVFGATAAFGVGNLTQINAVVSGINDCMVRFGGEESFRQNLAYGLILAVLVGAVLLGGADRIGAAAEMLVPFVSVIYVLLCMGVLIFRADAITVALQSIVVGAFSPAAVTGGVLGSSFRALRIGCSRGVFTNEAGMGTASIAHASANVNHPAEQGLMGIVEVFLDTIVLCTLTALVILTCDIGIPYGTDAGGSLTAAAFASVYGDGISIVLTGALCCFAMATVLGWGLYGTRCAQFLFGDKGQESFALIQTAAIVVGAVMKTETVWMFSELFNGLMAIPNLISLAFCSPELIRLTKEYKNKPGGIAAEGGNYADFHQCKPLRAFSYAEIPSLCHGGRKGRKENLSSEHRSA